MGVSTACRLLLALLLAATVARAEEGVKEDPVAPAASIESGDAIEGDSAVAANAADGADSSSSVSWKSWEYWRQRDYGVGLGFTTSETFLMDVYVKLNERWSLRGFGSLPISLGFQVLMPDTTDVLRSRLKVNTPEQPVQVWGFFPQHLGLEAVYFPWLSSRFFVSGGLAYRIMRGDAEARTPVYVCFVEGETPCNKKYSSFREDLFAADVTLTAIYEAVTLRGAVGWQWQFGQHGYFALHAFGLAQPFFPRHKIEVEATLVTDADLEGIEEFVPVTQEYVDYKEASLRRQAEDMGSLLEKYPLPIIGFSGGVRF